ncbi:MAG TPA: squalene/phytoene synthase family protein [Chloroflexia bacterium]|nr:squalene/phytoene synthase family protein [Chloroflexia bacterium]
MAEPGFKALKSPADSTIFNQTPCYNRIECFDTASIEAAYEFCRQMTSEGSKTFYFGSLFLPREKRRAMWAVYSFCRYTDDLVDKAEGAGIAALRERLAAWEENLRRSYEGLVPADSLQMLAWQHAVQTYSIPAMPPLELIEGVRMDLEKNRYANFDELRLYCYRVASTVGLMASQVIGYNDACALEYAINLGIAMQLTNILRDVGEDLANGRIYLPQDEMAEYGYTEAQLLRGEINQNFIRLMQFQIARAREYFAQATPGIQYLDKECRLAITLAARLYSQILDSIERNGYDVFNKRAYVSTRRKLTGLAEVLLRLPFGQKPLPVSPLLHLPEHEEADA